MNPENQVVWSSRSHYHAKRVRQFLFDHGLASGIEVHHVVLVHPDDVTRASELIATETDEGAA